METKVALVLVAQDEKFSNTYTHILKEAAERRSRQEELYSEKGLYSCVISASIEKLKSTLNKGAHVVKSFTEADVRIFAPLDQPANDLMDELECAMNRADFCGEKPIICRLSDAVAKYCHCRSVRQLWVHHSRVGNSYLELPRKLSQAKVMPVGAPPRFDADLEHLLLEAASSPDNAAVACLKQGQLCEALEFFCHRTNTQGVLLDHWAWALLANLPPHLGEPYLLSATNILNEYLLDLILSYC